MSLWHRITLSLMIMGAVLATSAPIGWILMMIGWIGFIVDEP